MMNQRISQMAIIIVMSVMVQLPLAQNSPEDQRQQQQQKQGDGGILQTIITSLIPCAIGFLLFFIFKDRLKFARCFRFRERLLDGKPPKMARGIVPWVNQLLLQVALKQEVKQLVSVDAYVYLLFMHWSVRVLAAMAVLGLVILVPVNASSGSSEGYNQLTIDNVPDGSSALWAHLVISYAMVSVLLFGLTIFLENYEMLRVSFLRRLVSQINGRSVIIRAIPREFQSPNELKNWIAQLLKRNDSADLVEQITFVSDNKELDKALKERTQALKKTEQYVAKYVQNPAKSEYHNESSTGASGGAVEHSRSSVALVNDSQKRPLAKVNGNQVDAIDHWTQKFTAADQNVQKLRQRSSDDQRTSSCAIVTFKDALNAAVFLSVPVTHSTDKYLVLQAALPHDLIRPNLAMGLYQQTVRKKLYLAAVILITLFWVFPIAALATFLANIDQVSAIGASSWPSWLLGFVQGTLPPLVTVIFIAIVPVIFTILAKLGGASSTSKVSRIVFQSLYGFQLVNVILVNALSSGILSVITNIQSNPTSVVGLLAQSLPQFSNFFVNYVIIVSISSFGFGFFSIGSVVISTLLRMFLCKTPRSYMENDWLNSSGVFSEAVHWVGAIVIWNIACIYMVISPLVLPFAALFFVTQYLINKYQLVWVQMSNKYESGGIMFVKAFNCLMVGLYLFALTTGGLFLSKKVIAQAVLQFIMIPLLALFHVWARSRYILRNMQPALTTLAGVSGGHGTPSQKLMSGHNHQKLQSQVIDVLPVAPMGTMNAAEIIDRNQYAYEKTDYREGPSTFSVGVLDAYWVSYRDASYHGQLPQLWFPTVGKQQRNH